MVLFRWLSSSLWSPRNVVVWRKVAFAFFRMGEKDRCEGCLLKALECSPRSYAILMDLVGFYSETERWEDCRTYLSKVLNHWPQDATAGRYLARLQEKTKGHPRLP
jgi:tetratricopeptide (TPR) repeat protein